jgi:hypothetical protein
MFKQLFRKNNSALKAVYEDDLIGYLKSIDIFDDVVGGKHLCVYCGNKITIGSLEVIVPKGDKVDIVCNNKNCLNQL